LTINLFSTSLSSQDLTSCNEPYIIDLSTGYSVAGFGLNGCGCSEEVDDCELIHIIMRRVVDDEIELLECQNIALTERWWREEEDYIDIYNPITCEEYPESETHSDRYEFNTSHLGPGDTLTILLCKTDPYNDNLVELRAYTGEGCKESICPPLIDCPATFKLRKNLDCEYELPDFTSGITLTDTCQSPIMDVSEEYFIIQNPPAGTIIEDSTFVEIIIEDQDRIEVGRCDIYVTLAGDPPPEMDDPDPISDIIHGDVMPDFQLLIAHDTMYDNSIIQVQVTTTIDDFTPAPCEGYQVKYIWSATDACANTITKEQIFNVLPDTKDPIFASVPIDIDTIEAGQPFPILVDLVAINADGSTDGITMGKSIDPYQENLCQGYPVTYRWTATDECNNTSYLDKTFYVKAVNAPPVFLDAIAPIEDITHGDPLPTPQELKAMSANGDTSNITVSLSITPYIENQCEGYEVEYVWIATDSCSNIATTSTTFTVLPEEIDFDDMFEMNDISLILGPNCEQEAVIVMPDILDRYDNIGVSYSIYDEQWNKLIEIDGPDESSYAFASGTSYVVYSILHQCGPSFRDTVAVTAEDLQAPVLECIDDITLYVNDPSSCTASGTWNIPQVLDNCGNATIIQIEGPSIGSPIPTGKYSISYEASDAIGNKDTCTFQLDVLPFSIEDFKCTSVEVDIDEFCNAWIDLNAIIQENSISCVMDLSVSIIVNSDTLYGPEINLQPYKGQEIPYEICDEATGICCQNVINLRDQNAPTIICAEDIYVSCLFSAEEYRPQVAAECGEVRWTYTEQGNIENCDNDSTKSTLIRTFYAIDDEGNTSAPCLQYIHILHAQLDQQLDSDNIIFPSDTTLNCDLYDFTNKTSSYSGIPKIGNFPILLDTPNKCGISASYEDDIISSSGCTKIVHRKWTLNEPICQNGVNTQTHTQIIKFVDRTAPEVRLTKRSYTLGSEGHTCQIEFPIPDIHGVDNCDSELEYNILHNGYWYDTSIPSLTLTSGVNKLLIRAKDDCNNYGFDTITVHIRDPIIPVAVCFENTNVSISASSVAVYATDLDAGSYDNCQLEKVEIKRSKTTCTIEDSKYKDHVTFCCEDIGSTVEIYLKATDQSGNTNFCTAHIKVVDKTPPTLTIPPNLTVDCKIGITKKEGNDPYGHLFGIPSIQGNKALPLSELYIINTSGPLLSGTISDNCPEDIIVDIKTESNVNDCGIGTIKRIFTSIDKYGNRSASQTQIIKVVGGINLDTNAIVWPRLDTTIIECNDITDIDPDILGRPYIKEELCALYGLTYEDVYYNLIGDTNGACSKMSRTWTVINWCDINASLYASKTQIIKLIDTEDPEIQACSSDREIYGEGIDCNRIRFNIRNKANDNCTSDAHLIWSIVINEDSNASERIENISIDSNGWANTELILPIGSHSLTWYVEDQCGNQTSCHEVIHVDSDKAPTPYATGLTTAISSSRQLEISASDLLAKAEHACYDNLKISIARSGVDFEDARNSIQFDCSDIGTNYIDVFASRELTNGKVTHDYTTVKIEIQDNWEFCDYGNSPEEGAQGIIGSISTSYGVVLQNALVFLEDMFTADIEETETDNTGSYTFSNINNGRPYSIQVAMEDSRNNGLTTRDVILIQQHLMGINSFTSHWKMLESDVNQDQRVSSIDIVELRKTIIGQASEMDQYPPWRFFDTQLAFEPMNYSVLQELKDGVYISNMSSTKHADITGLKMGDVDHSANLSDDWGKSRSINKHKLRYYNQQLSAGQETAVELFLDDAEGLGWQFELLVSDHLEILEISSPYANESIITSLGNTIYSSTSRANPWKLNTSSPILTIKVRALTDITTKELISLSSSNFRSEFYDADLNIHKLEIEHIEEVSQISVTAAAPNPFNSITSISISVPSAQQGHMIVSDATGITLQRTSLDLNSGLNKIDLHATDFVYQGLYFIQLNIDGQTFTERLILTH